MNKRQKLVQEAFLDNEEVVISRLKKVYDKSLDDITKKAKELQDQINTLDALADMTDDADEKARLLSMQQSKVYQKQYQDALKKQVSSILDNMQVEEFKTVSEYLQKCYEDGFIGTMFDLQGQGIPLCFPLDQEAMIRAVQTDSKISQGLYTRLGEDITLLKRKITAQVSRGISTGMTFAQVAQQLAAYTNIGLNNAVRIARTEGHRIQVQSAMDACYKAKDSGADVVKQWDSTLDRRTRKSHQQVDGEIRELDEPFSNGLMFPGDPDGGAAEVVNCRCALLQRARWALDADELEALQDRAAYYGLDKTESLKEFAKQYKIAMKEEVTPLFDRTIPDIEYDITIEGLNIPNHTPTLTKIDDKHFTVSFAKGESVGWNLLSEDTQNRIRWNAPQRVNEKFTVAKGSYDVQPYVAGSSDYIKREEIAKSIGGKYIGTAWQKKYGALFDIDFYQTDAGIMFTMGKAKVNKALTPESIKNVAVAAKEREKIIVQELKKNNVNISILKEREGDDWANSMKKFHTIIKADGKPSVVSKAEYDAIKSPVLYRGIAPQSHLRKDITNNLTPQQMADGFFEDSQPFPSRGVYGDGIAYCSPSLNNIAANYASAYGTIPKGGKVIEFKLKEGAKTISYEDALELFHTISDSTNSNLLFAKEQKKAYNKEVGKALNALGYDAIIEDNGDGTGIPFYVILNRAALVTKEDWTTVTVTPEWLKKVRIL